MLEFKAKMFDNVDKLIRDVNRTERRFLFKVGGYLRAVAMKSIRTRKGTSQPGQPPHSHVGTLRRLIAFAVDRYGESVTVGPLSHGKFLNEKGPGILEHGGTRTVYRGGKTITQRYAARPYLAPALRKTEDAMSKLWRDSIR